MGIKEFFRPTKGKVIIFIVLMVVYLIIGLLLRSTCFGGLCPFIWGDLIIIFALIPIKLILGFESAVKIDRFTKNYVFLMILISAVLTYFISSLIVAIYNKVRS